MCKLIGKCVSLAIAQWLGLVQGSGVSGPLLQNINLQMARNEYELNGQQGLDQLLSVLGGEEVQVALRPQSLARPTQPAYAILPYRWFSL